MTDISASDDASDTMYVGNGVAQGDSSSALYHAVYLVVKVAAAGELSPLRIKASYIV
jgi:hypothetical protein